MDSKCDDCDMLPQMRSPYTKSNKFSHCLISV